MPAQNSDISSARRKLETEGKQMRAELDEVLAEEKAADVRAKNSVVDVSGKKLNQYFY